MQRLDQTGLRRWKELRESNQVVVASCGELKRSVHVDADHVAAWREPQLSLAGHQHAPGLVLLNADQGVLAVGTGASSGSGLASGAGEVVVAAGSAVFGPSTKLEVPAAEGPQPFFAAFSSTWRSVNSWNNRSPTG